MTSPINKVNDCMEKCHVQVSCWFKHDYDCINSKFWERHRLTKIHVVVVSKRLTQIDDIGVILLGHEFSVPNKTNGIASMISFELQILGFRFIFVHPVHVIITEICLLQSHLPQNIYRLNSSNCQYLYSCFQFIKDMLLYLHTDLVRLHLCFCLVMHWVLTFVF